MRLAISGDGFFDHGNVMLPSLHRTSLSVNHLLRGEAAERQPPPFFLAAVENGPLSATQFHPEKSADAGIRLLSNWIRSLG